MCAEYTICHLAPYSLTFWAASETLMEEDVITKKSGSPPHQEVNVEVIHRWDFTGMKSRQKQYNISHHSDLPNEQFTDDPNRHWTSILQSIECKFDEGLSS